MDPYAQYQQQQQPQQDSYGDPSQSYDQAYYASYNQSQIQQYPYDNYAQYYSNANYQFQYSSESNPIYPPGVPIPPDPTHLLNPEQTPLHHNSYYPQTEVAPYVGNVDSSQQYYGGHVAAPQIAQTPYSGAGNTKGSGTVRGTGRGHFGPRSHGSGPFRGSRVRGRGRSTNAARNSMSTDGVSGSQLPTVPAPVRAPARIAWCEICRVDCNTAEILEQHKNGKKHKKSLKFQEELQKLNKIPVSGPSEQVLNSKLKPEASNETGMVESSGEKKLPEALLSNQSVTNENKPVEQKDSDKAEQTDELTNKPGMDNSVVRGQGLKRRMRGGKGGKWMKTHDGSRRPVEPPKSKAVPLICELCNATCESTIVFDSHLKGKKHLANVKRFQGQQEAALQVIYPALQALYPTLQALCQLNGNSSSPFAPQFPKQDIHGSQSFTEPGSYVFPRGQSSASGPSANATSDPILESNVQQTSMLDGSTSALNNSQDEPLQFVKVADLPVQSTSVGKTESEIVQSDQVSLPITESNSEQLLSKSK